MAVDKYFKQYIYLWIFRPLLTNKKTDVINWFSPFGVKSFLTREDLPVCEKPTCRGYCKNSCERSESGVRCGCAAGAQVAVVVQGGSPPVFVDIHQDDEDCPPPNGPEGGKAR